MVCVLRPRTKQTDDGAAQDDQTELKYRHGTAVFSGRFNAATTLLFRAEKGAETGREERSVARFWKTL